MNASPKIAAPGDVLGTNEEFLSGEGTYEDEGKIYASVVGPVFIDDKELTITVRCKNPPVELQRGDHVIARVIALYDSMVLVEVLMRDGDDRAISSKDTSAVIHVSKIDRRYTDDIKREFRRGDLIRTEIIQVKPSLQLVTNYPHLGVIRGLCIECRSTLQKTNNGLVCSNCGRRETRKMADDYGNVRFRRRGE
ncbi:MAG: exosome complex RNA-binding protein Csl4 [Thermoplasmata archaeon]|nr:exosome complex RNA-binding protein Csl4 [Thermoplasmata archaeon]